MFSQYLRVRRQSGANYTHTVIEMAIEPFALPTIFKLLVSNGQKKLTDTLRNLIMVIYIFRPVHAMTMRVVKWNVASFSFASISPHAPPPISRNQRTFVAEIQEYL